MKRYLSIALVALLLLGVMPALALAAYQPGTYSATQQGFGGEVIVTIETDENSILSVSVIGDAETPQIGGRAVAEMPALLLAAQGEAIDGMSGATVTSGAILSAFESALMQAKGEDAQAVAMTPGTYTATTKGFGGYVVTTVEVSEDAIPVHRTREYTVREPEHRPG